MLSIPDPAREREASAIIRALGTGVVTGLLLTGILLVSLILANRVPSLESFAFLRNLLACGVALLVMLLPLIRFHRSPGSLFISGVLGWAIFSLGYSLANIYFQSLENRLGKTGFEFLVMGSVIYGIVAATLWVTLTILSALHPFASAHRRETPQGTPRS